MKDIVNTASLQRLKFCNFKLDSLLEITQAINENQSTSLLLNKYERLLCRDLNIGKVILFQNDAGSWVRLLESGFEPGGFESINVQKELVGFEEITTTLDVDNPQVKEFDLIIPVYQDKKPLAFVLVGDIEDEKEGVSPTIKHLRFIQTLTNIIIVAIENKRLIEVSLRQEALRKELELASKMQEMLVPDPKLFPKNDNIIVDAFYYPHFKVGGDYYDYVQLSDDEFGFCIADVSGKGITAALMMSNFQASLRALFTSNISISSLITKLNKIILDNTQGDRFITLFLAKYNYKSRILTYINAGHNPPTVFLGNSKKIVNLSTGCPGLGMLDKMPFIREGMIKIPPGTKMLCYTDGVVELEDNNGKEIGQDAIYDAIAKSEKISDVLAAIIKTLSIKKENKNLFDDITILGLDFI